MTMIAWKLEHHRGPDPGPLELTRRWARDSVTESLALNRPLDPPCRLPTAAAGAVDSRASVCIAGVQRGNALPSAGGIAVTLGIGMLAVILLLTLPRGFPWGSSTASTESFSRPAFASYEGQAPGSVRFVASRHGTDVALAPGALLWDWKEYQPLHALRLELGNPLSEPEVEQTSQAGGGAETLRYRQAWPGVDALIRTTEKGVAYDLVVQPGVDPAVIQLSYPAAAELSVLPDGGLSGWLADEGWTEGLPSAWQDGPTGREAVQADYLLLGNGRFGFRVGAYDPTRPLVIDPPIERAS